MATPQTHELTREQAYFDHALDVRERKRQQRQEWVPASTGKDSMAVTLARREKANQLRGPNEAPAFGRITLADGERIYVGYDGILDPETQDLLVANWKSPVGALYETATVEDPHGLTSKRAYTCENTRILRYEDYVYAELAASIEALGEEVVFDDALLSELNRGRTGEMHEVVKTIQASQSPLIRTPLDRLLVIQGGPGTGKTVVALHRVSWLLYNYEQLNADRVLVIGPNTTFVRYVRGVLPALGDSEVRHMNLARLGPAVSLGREESRDTTRLKGDARMALLLRRALVDRVSLPDDATALTVRLPMGEVTWSRARLQRRIGELTGLGDLPTPYSDARRGFRDFMITEARSSAKLSESDLRGQREIDNLLERIWPAFSAPSFVQSLYGSRARLLDAGGDDFSAREIVLLERRTAERLSDETWSEADIPVLDEVEALLNGIMPDDRFDHVVVDEAQDLSPMQLRTVARRSSSGSMTVVGDMAQSTGMWARDSWNEVLNILPTNHESTVAQLEYGYRVPKQVYEFAARLLPAAAPHVEAARVVRQGPSEPNVQRHAADDLAKAAVAAAMDHSAHGRSVGMIVTPEWRPPVEDALRAHDVAWDDAANGELGRSINLMSAEESKGLEFDAAVVVEPAAIVAQDPRGERLLHVALTRTTKYLDVLHSENLPEALGGGEPAPILRKKAEGDVLANEPAADARRERRLQNKIIEMTVADIADEVSSLIPAHLWDVFVEGLIDDLARRRRSG